MPVLNLAVLYELAIIPVALLWGVTLATIRVGREHARLQLVLSATDAHVSAERCGDWLALTVFLVTAVAVSVLATQARRRAQLAAERGLESRGRSS